MIKSKILFQLTSVTKGYGFTIGINTEGELFGRGLNTMGQLGLQVDADLNQIELLDKFEKINFDETFHGDKFR